MATMTQYTEQQLGAMNEEQLKYELRLRELPIGRGRFSRKNAIARIYQSQMSTNGSSNGNGHHAGNGAATSPTGQTEAQLNSGSDAATEAEVDTTKKKKPVNRQIMGEKDARKITSLLNRVRREVPRHKEELKTATFTPVWALNVAAKDDSDERDVIWAKKCSDLERQLGSGDFWVFVNQDLWKDQSEEQKLCAIDCILCAMARRTDKDGDQVIDELKNKVWRLPAARAAVPPEAIARHGIVNRYIGQVFEAFKAHAYLDASQPLFASLEEDE